MVLKSIENGLKVFLSNVKKHDVEVYTGFGIVGMISGTALAVKATPKAIRLIEAKKEEKNVEKLDAIETVKTVGKCYIPAIIIEAFAIYCFVASNLAGKKKSAALAVAYSLSEQALKEYQDKVVETIGEKKETAIRDEIAKDKLEKNPVKEEEIIFTGRGDTLCYDSLSGRYFKSDIESIRKSENEFNRWLRDENYIPLNEWYSLIGLDGIELGNDLGWNYNEGDMVLMFSSQLSSKDKPCLVIGYRTPPYYYYHSRY